MEKLNVVSPVGLPLVKPATAAKRLETLEGKTIGEIWNGDFKGDVTFPIIREALQRRFPSLRFVPFNKFPYSHVSDNASKQRERASLIATLAKENACDAVITGNGA
jgi:hypothetical protein